MTTDDEEGPVAPKTLWSSVSRNDCILAEATSLEVYQHEHDNVPTTNSFSGTNPATCVANHTLSTSAHSSASSPLIKLVAQTARELLARPSTPGFEFHTTSTQSKLIRIILPSRFSSIGPPHRITTGGNCSVAPQQLKGIKFHVYEHVSPLDDFDASMDGGSIPATTTQDTRTTTAMATATESLGSSLPPHLNIWVFAAVYDPRHAERFEVQAFLEKMVVLTENFRHHDPQWQTTASSTRPLEIQSTFAPILLQRMQEVSHLAKMIALEQQMQACQEQMERNVTLILGRGDRLDEMQENATRMQEMAAVFKKKTKQAKRYHMMKHAIHGLILGTAVTAVTAVVVGPPLVAIL